MIIVVGLAFEARIAAGPGMRVVCGGDSRHLSATLAATIAEARTLFGSCPGIISFGVAGGLAPQLRPGTCVIGSAILSGSNRMPTNQIWSQQLLRTFPDAVSGVLLGVSAPICDPRRPNGTTNIGAMIKAVLMRPREIPALFQTAFDALAARVTLVRGRRLLGPSLLLVNSLECDPVTANEPYLGPAIQTATMEGA
ncbi:MAG TPA: hypothetical protein VLJ17_11715 [Xanthobacteraceae bacterium]|nr:hypothetical protein [Xanthobacteraceae bacterium]